MKKRLTKWKTIGQAAGKGLQKYSNFTIDLATNDAYSSFAMVGLGP